MRTSIWYRRRWFRWVAGGFLAALAALAVAVAVLVHRAEPFLRARIVDTLSARFHARVELDEFHLALGNSLRGEWGVWATGRGLRIWPPAETAGAAAPDEPLIRLDEFRFHAPLRYQPGVPAHISQVRLSGLTVRVPPRPQLPHPAQGASAAVTSMARPDAARPPLVRFQVDSIECGGARLVLGTSNPNKLPLEFAIAHLKLHEITPQGAMHFDAELTNPRPSGTIRTVGSFGPWQMSDPGESPVAGDYRFEHADLASFRGIAGVLTSTGHYGGTLRDLTVDGQTDTPNFRLSHFDNPLPLHTLFHARVDGTNGDTWLDAVDARLGTSHLKAQGQIVRVLAESGGSLHSIGHDIALNVQVDRGRMEDFLHLMSHGDTPLLTGALTLKTTLHISPGPVPVHERMALNGQFALNEAQFTSAKVRDRIRELSLRGQGRPDDLKSPDAAGVDSQMQGDFHLAGGVITLPDLQYNVPGAAIRLKGTYTLEGGALDFAGTARTQATVSQMVGGWKGMLLKPADRFFKRDGAGAEIPIHIRGTRTSPDFGIDLNRLKTTSPESPATKQ